MIHKTFLKLITKFLIRKHSEPKEPMTLQELARINTGNMSEEKREQLIKKHYKYKSKPKIPYYYSGNKWSIFKKPKS